MIQSLPEPLHVQYLVFAAVHAYKLEMSTGQADRGPRGQARRGPRAVSCRGPHFWTLKNKW